MPTHDENEVVPRPCSPEQICTACLGICNRHLHVGLLDRLRHLNADVDAWPSALAAGKLNERHEAALVQIIGSGLAMIGRTTSKPKKLRQRNKWKHRG